MELIRLTLGPMAVNCYLLARGDEAVVVDPGEARPVLELLAERGLRLGRVLLTHLHCDHTAGVADIAAATGATVSASSADLVLRDEPLFRGGIWGAPEVADFHVEPARPGRGVLLGQPMLTIETPGHSPGGLAFFFPAQGMLFTGDLIFRRQIGNTTFPGSDATALFASVRSKVFTLPEATRILPGHGEETTVGEEMRESPFFR